MSNQFSAGPSALGYIYQLIHYALYVALNQYDNPDLCIRLEKLDDIDLVDGATPKESIQVKHKTKDLTDRSEDFWGPIRIWSENFASGNIRLPGTILSLVTTARAADNSIASLLRPTHTRHVDEALALMRTESKRVTDSLEQAFTAFCSLQPHQQRNLVEAIHILDKTPSIDQIDSLIMARLVGVHQKHQATVYSNLQGWWLKKVVEHLRSGSKVAIEIASIREKIAQLNDQYKEHLQDPFIDVAPPTNYDYDDRTFVLQLRIIDLPPELIGIAKYEYYRTSMLRSWLVNEFHVSSLTAYDQRLVAAWVYRFYDVIRKRNASKCDDLTKKDIGQDIYLRVQQEVNDPIHSDMPDPFYTRGSYQVLADAVGIPEIGWHPNFQAVLQEALKGTDDAMGEKAG